MPADDLVLNVRQIAGYTPASSAVGSDTLLLQRGGLGGPYLSIDAADFVGTALSGGGDMAVGGKLSASAFQGGSAQFSNASANLLWAQTADLVNFNAATGSIGCVRIATVADLAAQYAASVNSFNGRIGAVQLWIDDIICAGGAPIYSPRFSGEPRACTPPPTSNSSRLATTAFVQGMLGQLTLDYAPLDSPNFIGVPTAPTAPLGSADGTSPPPPSSRRRSPGASPGCVVQHPHRHRDADQRRHHLGWRRGPQLSRLHRSADGSDPAAVRQLDPDRHHRLRPDGKRVRADRQPQFHRHPDGSDADTGDQHHPARHHGLCPSRTRRGQRRGSDVQRAVRRSQPARQRHHRRWRGDLGLPGVHRDADRSNPPPGDSSTRLATTAYVQSLAGFAPLASPAFTGVPTAPTAAPGANTSQSPPRLSSRRRSPTPPPGWRRSTGAPGL